ncbi:hypothetical protein AB0478_17755 [Streptomyces sp. NPDC051917]|uniref:hypothetical protein n=1 Tax=Streptomyces sp. NPDC051917 TaxID=3154754 RepID=UPI00344E731A
MNRFQFVADHQRRYGVKRLCAILGIARSSFYYWRRTAEDRAARQAADARLAARIRAVHRESDGTYGVPRSRRPPVWLLLLRPLHSRPTASAPRA